MAQETKETKINGFEEAIKAYLQSKADKDSLFAKTFAKENKNIKECCQYIIEEARKVKDGTVSVMSDEAVFALAVHYYDEDDIVVKKPATPVKVATPTAPAKPKVEKPKPQPQPSLFDGFDW